MEKYFSMKAGDGESSYAQNSSVLQKNILMRAKPFIEESIRSWNTTFECEALCIADLGCSSGPNALFVSDLITSEIGKKYAHKGIRVPEFQVFFNDLPSSDFNTLFKLLMAEERCYLVAGVPGSFYKRLFAPNSLHFVHCANSLHWLSRVPVEIEDKHSKCWNKGRIHISPQGPREIGDAYFAQFQNDFKEFLRARAKEVVKGGRMFLVLTSRSSADRRQSTSFNFFWEALGIAIKDLVSQGIIEEERLDSFNMPNYQVSEDELRSEVCKEGSFSIVELQFVIIQGNIDKYDDNDKGKLLSKQMRAVLEGLISLHFGENVVDAIFDGYAEVLTKNIMEVEERMQQATRIAITLERVDST